MREGSEHIRTSGGERLLPGEDPESRNVDDAQHWVEVYDELVRFSADLIVQTQSRLATLPGAAWQRAKELAIAKLVADVERFDGRLQFWRLRLRALEHVRSG